MEDPHFYDVFLTNAFKDVYLYEYIFPETTYDLVFSIFFHAILPRRFWVWEFEPAPLRVVFSHAIIALGSIQYTHCWLSYDHFRLHEIVFLYPWTIA